MRSAARRQSRCQTRQAVARSRGGCSAPMRQERIGAPHKQTAGIPDGAPAVSSCGFGGLLPSAQPHRRAVLHSEMSKRPTRHTPLAHWSTGWRGRTRGSGDFGGVQLEFGIACSVSVDRRRRRRGPSDLQTNSTHCSTHHFGAHLQKIYKARNSLSHNHLQTPPGRLERPANSLGNCCSIHLSYGGHPTN